MAVEIDFSLSPFSLRPFLKTTRRKSTATTEKEQLKSHETKAKLRLDGFWVSGLDYQITDKVKGTSRVWNFWIETSDLRATLDKNWWKMEMQRRR